MTEIFVRMVRQSVCPTPDCNGEDFVGEGGKPLTIRPDGSVADAVVVCATCGSLCEIGALDDGEYIDVEYFDHALPAGTAPPLWGPAAAQDAKRNI